MMSSPAKLLLVIFSVFTVGASAQNTFPSSGNVGIGTTSPSSTLNVAGNGTIVGNSHGIIVGTINDLINTNVPVGGVIGTFEIGFPGWRDMEPNQIGAKIVGVRVNTWQPNNALVQGTELAFYTGTGATGNNPAFHDTSSQKMLIDVNGNVGIGTTSPEAPLTVSNYQLNGLGTKVSINTAFWTGEDVNLVIGGDLNGSSTPFLQSRSNGSANTIGPGNYNLALNPYGGNVGIGTVAPQFKLDVAGVIRASGGVVFPDGSTQTTAYPASASDGTAPLQVVNNETVVNNGISANGTGLKHMRTDDSCTTGGNINDTCQILIAWPGTPFADTNYTVTCTPKAFSYSSSGATIVSYTFLIPDSGKTQSSTTIIVQNLDSNAHITISGLNCIAIHD